MNTVSKNIALLLLRVGFSAGMMTHGYSKFQKLLDGNMNFADPLGIGEAPSLILTVLGEFIAPVFVMIGLKTRYAAVPVAITMGVAAFVVHEGDPFSDREMAIIYMIGFIAIALLGGGKWVLKD